MTKGVTKDTERLLSLIGREDQRKLNPRMCPTNGLHALGQ